MVKVISCIALVLVISASAHPQPKTTREADHLFGPVHTLTATNLTMTKLNDLWAETSRRVAYFREYDENGNDKLRSLGPDAPQSTATCTHKYNDAHQEIETECDWHGQSIKILFQYDNAGHVVDRSQQNNGKLVSRVTYSFDDKGHMTSLGQFDSENTPTRKLTWSYDANGNAVEFMESVLKDGKMSAFQKNVATFDDKGNVLTSTQTGNPEGMTFTEYFVYQFDSWGNWIVKESAMLPFDSPDLRTKLVEVRVITYYDK